jgi:hypothetical protein
MRSFRSERVSRLVKEVLDLEVASVQAERLKPHALDVKTPVH